MGIVGVVKRTGDIAGGPWAVVVLDPLSDGVLGGGVSRGGLIEGWSPKSSSCCTIICIKDSFFLSWKRRKKQQAHAKLTELELMFLIFGKTREKKNFFNCWSLSLFASVSNTFWYVFQVLILNYLPPLTPCRRNSTCHRRRRFPRWCHRAWPRWTVPWAPPIRTDFRKDPSRSPDCFWRETESPDGCEARRKPCSKARFA